MKHITSLLFVVAMALSLDGLQAAEKKETPKEREAREAAAEALAESKLPESEQIALFQKYAGRYNPNPAEDNPENPEVIGTLTTTQGNTYQLKLAKPDLLKRLQDHVKEVVVLTAKLRNGGKYLLVSDLTLPEAPPLERKKRGGI